jgi:hypothetical protein
MVLDRGWPVALLLWGALSGCRVRDQTEAQARALSAGFVVDPAHSVGAAASDPAYNEVTSPTVAYGAGTFLAAWCAEDHSEWQRRLPVRPA